MDLLKICHGRHRCISIGLVFGLLIAVLLGIGLFVPFRHCCKPYDDGPPRLKYSCVASDDYRNLGLMAGSIKLSHRSDYLPVDTVRLVREDWPLDDYYGISKSLVFKSDCAELNMTLSHVNDSVRVTSLVLNKIFRHERPLKCESDQLKDLSKLVRNHYECHDFEIKCYDVDTDELIGVMQVSEFKLEIDGDPELIKKARFSKNPMMRCPG